MTRHLTIVDESRGEVYRKLVEYAAAAHGSFMLVWQDQLAFDEQAQSIEQRLRPDLVIERRTESWPGTELIGHSATVRRYRFSPDATRLLLEAERLYAWRSRSRPEDLSFWTPAETAWLGSIAHERDAFVNEDEIDLGALRQAVPGLVLRAENAERIDKDPEADEADMD